MATPFGNPSGPLFPLGLLAVTAGTPTPLSANVSLNTPWGTGTSQTTVVATQLILSTPSTNTGDVQLVFKSQGAAAGSGTSVIVNVPKGTTYTLASPQLSNPFQLVNLGIDGAHTGDGVYVTAVIV